MMPETDLLESAGRYQRVIDQEGEDSLSAIARRIAPGSRVLDLGTGPGALGAYLTAVKGCEVDGVDSDPEAARLARGFYRAFCSADLERACLPELFPDRHYQVIVCADIIEHLRDPGTLLRQLPALLESSGKVLLSVPNVSYCGVLGELLEGKFRYRPSGLLDSTHLRFFTRSSLLELLREHGLHPVRLAAVIQDPVGSEFNTCFNALPPKIQQALLSRPDALSYQFLVEAAAEPSRSVEVGDLEPVPAAWPFVAQLYWRQTGEDFSETASVAVNAQMDEARQTVRFSIPPLERAAELRLDPADRPGFLHLFGLRLRAADGETLWQPGLRQLADVLQSAQVVAADADESLNLLLASTDPALRLPVPEQALAELREGGVLEVELAWPASADFLRLAETFRQQAAQHDQQLKAQRAALAKKDERIRSLQGIIAPRTAEIVSLRHRGEELAGSLQQAKAKIAALEEERSEAWLRLETAEAANAELTRRSAEAEQFAAALQATLSWRWTAPLRRSRARIRAFLAPWRRMLSGRKCRMVLAPGNDLLSAGNGKFLSTGNDPQLFLHAKNGRLPTGWCRFSLRGQGMGQPLTPVLFVDDGGGFREETKITLPATVNNAIDSLIHLPVPVTALRLDPLAAPGEFHLDEVSIRETCRSAIVAQFLSRLLREGSGHPSDLVRAFRKGWAVFLQSGVAGLKAALIRKSMGGADPAFDYQHWIQLYDLLTDTDRAAIRCHIDSLPVAPLISIVMPTYNTPEKWLRLAIESVRRQLYPHWELCIADDASTQGHVRKILEEYQALDPRIKICFRQKNGHISAASNSALEMASGEYIALLDHDDEIPEHALYTVAEEINQHPDADLIYSDEDKINESGERFDPYFKSDWNPDLLTGQNFISHLGVYRTALVRAVGGFREGFEGSQDWDLALRLSEGMKAEKVRHIARVLYHWRILPGSTALAAGEKSYAASAARRALLAHFERIGTAAEVLPKIGGYWRARYPVPQPPPLVSILIPTRNGYRVLSRCIDSILGKTKYPAYEIVVIDNQSDDSRTLDYLNELRGRERARVIAYGEPFNYSAINNFAAHQARGEILVLINDDVEVITPDWLEELVSHAARPDIGAVGGMLYYPDRTIQHAGVILGLLGVANHAYLRKPQGYPGQMGRASLVQNLSAVTAACLAIRRDLYFEVGGLNELHLAVAFNDIDFCLRVKAAGYRNLWTPFAELLHHESFTRGRDDCPEKQERFCREIDYMQRQWGHLLGHDPAYNPNLSLGEESFSLAFPPRTEIAWKAFL